jgi:hypothetical protein
LGTIGRIIVKMAREIARIAKSEPEVSPQSTQRSQRNSENEDLTTDER